MAAAAANEREARDQKERRRRKLKITGVVVEVDFKDNKQRVGGGLL